jgi:sRNA-binding carbon storage regulator CsrA
MLELDRPEGMSLVGYIPPSTEWRRLEIRASRTRRRFCRIGVQAPKDIVIYKKEDLSPEKQAAFNRDREAGLEAARAALATH